MGWLLAIELGILTGEYIYHRLTEKDDKVNPTREVQIARTDEGAAVPYIYGLCRVDTPVLAWTSGIPQGKPFSDSVGGGPTIITGYQYQLDMFFLIGISMAFGNSTNLLHQVIVGDNALLLRAVGLSTITLLTELTGEGGYERDVRRAVLWNDASIVGRPPMMGEIEFLNGGREQLLVDATTPFALLTRTGEMMVDSGITASEISGFRGYLSASFSGVTEVSLNQFFVGTSPGPPNISFEVSSYPLSFNALSTSAPTIGSEANPADVIIDLLRNKFAKLGLPASAVNRPSFMQCADTLKLEAHGYSRAISSTDDAGKIIGEILEQIDGLLYVDPAANEIVMKLIRDDYDPGDVLALDESNCTMVSYAAGSWDNIVNKVRVVYSDRQLQYKENSETAHNQAGAVGQDGVVREYTVRYPGCCTAALARVLAGRELSARSRPIAKCSVEVNPGFVRAVQGQVIAVSWAEYGVSNLLFRIANIDRGALKNSRIRLDLIQETFHTYRGVFTGPLFDPFPTVSIDLG